jgi:anti-anti-sigma factor
MDVHVSKEGTRATVKPQGSVDTRSAPDLEEAMLKAVDEGATALVCDFTHVDLLTSGGIRVLVMIGKKLQRVDGALVLCGLNEYVYAVFEASGLLPLFTIVPGPADALARLAAPGAAQPVSKLARAVKRLLSFGDALPPHLGLPRPQPARPSALAVEITNLLQRAAERRH